MSQDTLARSALEAAEEQVRVSERMVDFIAGVSAPPGPADVAEYAALLRQEQAARRQRTAALRQLGLDAPSLHGDQPG